MNISPMLKNILIGVIPALLLIFCQWLADAMTEKSVMLSYTISVKSVSNLHVAYVEFSNFSKVAIDHVEIVSNPEGMIYSSYEPITQGASKSIWDGEILSGQSLKILYVLNKEMPISTSSLGSFLNAEYKERNEKTGKLEWAKVNLDEGEQFTLRTLPYLFWFFFPIVILLLIVIALGYYLRSDVKNT